MGEFKKFIPEFDYLIVGAGLFGAVFANKATSQGKRCLVIDKRDHIGGNIYTKLVNQIQVHQYGAHIFHTSNDEVWEYVNKFVTFNNFINSPIANFKGKLYNLPFNMNTFYAMWGVKTPEEAKKIIEQQKKKAKVDIPLNLEEQAINLVGNDIYQTLIKGYTEKQWGRDCKDLPPSIIKRLPVRFTFDNNYFNAKYQGIPINGYTKLVEKLLEGSKVCLNSDFLTQRDELKKVAHKIIYTGPIDAFFDYCFGALEYRSLRFETEELPVDNFQGVAVVNYTEREIPYTRIIEHKHFMLNCENKQTTILSKEYPDNWDLSKEPYYPVNDERNTALYNRYYELAKSQNDTNLIFGGRLGSYRYYDMDKVIEAALSLAKKEL